MGNRKLSRRRTSLGLNMGLWVRVRRSILSAFCITNETRDNSVIGCAEHGTGCVKKRTVIGYRLPSKVACREILSLVHSYVTTQRLPHIATLRKAGSNVRSQLLHCQTIQICFIGRDVHEGTMPRPFENRVHALYACTRRGNRAKHAINALNELPHSNLM